MAAQKGGNRRTGPAEGDVGQLDARSLVEHAGPQIIRRGAGAAPASEDAGGLFFGGLDEVLQGLVRAVLADEQDIRRALEHIDLLEVQRVVPGIAHLHRLDDRVGQVVPGDRVPVGLGPGQFRPAERPAAADLVGDGDIDAKGLLQGGLLESRGDIRLAAGIETDFVSDAFARELVRRGGRSDQNQGHHGAKNDKTHGNPFHLFPPHSSLI